MEKLFLLLFLFSAGCALHKGTGIVFTEGNWQDVLNKAKSDHKLIFVDVYATWCGPCKMLKNETFSNKRVGEYYNTHFVNATFNGEAGDGMMLSGKFGLRAYPSLYIVDSNGSVVSASIGYLSPKELVSFGKQVLNDK